MPRLQLCSPLITTFNLVCLLCPTKQATPLVNVSIKAIYDWCLQCCCHGDSESASEDDIIELLRGKRISIAY